MIKITGLRDEHLSEKKSARQIDAENQRNAWLRQLELGQLQLMQQQSEPKPGSNHQGQAGSVKPATLATSSQHVLRQLLTSPSSGAAQIHGRSYCADTTVHDATSTVPVDRGTIRADQARASDSTLMPGQMRSASEGNGISVHSVTTLPAALRMGNVDLTKVDEKGIGTTQPVNGLPLNAANVVKEVEDFGHVVTDREQVQSADLRPTAAALTREGVTQRSEDQVTADQENAVPADQDVPSSEPSTAADAAWQKRLVHVSQSGQQVSISIRDSALNSHRASQLVYRLAADIALSGMTLSTVTVNGRQMVRTPMRSAVTLHYRAPRTTASQTQMKPYSSEEDKHGA